MEDITTESLPDMGGEVAVDEGIGLAELMSKELGKNFTDDQAALKSIKDTQAYVGEWGKHKPKLEAVAKMQGTTIEGLLETLTGEKAPGELVRPSSQEVTSAAPEKFVSREQYEQDTFFAKNEAYVPYKDMIMALKNASGDSFEDVIQSDSFKVIYDKASAYDQNEGAKSVLLSSPRLGKVTDKMSQATKALRDAESALRAGDMRTSERAHSVAKASVVGAVLDAFEN